MFKRAIKKISECDTRKKIAIISATFLFLLISLISAIIIKNNTIILLTIFYSSILYFLNKMEVTKELFDDWIDAPTWLHYGIIVGTIIVTIPLIKSIYDRKPTGNE